MSNRDHKKKGIIKTFVLIFIIMISTPILLLVFQIKILPVPDQYFFASKQYEERYASENNKLKILVFRDSFFGAYSKFIADSFGESVFIWRHNFNKNLIEKEKPNIVFYEIIERNIDILLSMNFNHSPN